MELARLDLRMGTVWADLNVTVWIFPGLRACLCMLAVHLLAVRDAAWVRRSEKCMHHGMMRLASVLCARESARALANHRSL